MAYDSFTGVADNIDTADDKKASNPSEYVG